MAINPDPIIGQRTNTINVFYETGLDVKEGEIVMIDPEMQSTPEPWEPHQYPAPTGPCTTHWKLGYRIVGISPINVEGSKIPKLYPCVVSGSFAVPNYSGRIIEPGDRLIVGPNSKQTNGKHTATFHPINRLAFKLSARNLHLPILRGEYPDLEVFATKFCPSFTHLPLYASDPHFKWETLEQKDSHKHRELELVKGAPDVITSAYDMMRSSMVCAKAISKGGNGQFVTIILRF